MKLILYVILVGAWVCGSCSRPSAEERAAHLDSLKGEWTYDQTRDAVEIYLEALEEERALKPRLESIEKRKRLLSDPRASRAALHDNAQRIRKAQSQEP